LRGINIIQLLLQQLVLHQQLVLGPHQLVKLLPLRVVHVVYVVHGVQALERALQQVPFQHALHVNQ
jgi:hypothetical protein